MNFRKCAEAPNYWRYFSVSGFVKPLLMETASILSFSSLWLKDMAREQDGPSHLHIWELGGPSQLPFLLRERVLWISQLMTTSEIVQPTCFLESPPRLSKHRQGPPAGNQEACVLLTQWKTETHIMGQWPVSSESCRRRLSTPTFGVPQALTPPPACPGPAACSYGLRPLLYAHSVSGGRVVRAHH